MDMIQEIVRDRSRCCIVLDSGEKYWLRPPDLQETAYAPGQEVDRKDLEHFVLLHQYPRALNLAVSMLARRPCAKGEIGQKLKAARYSAKTVEMVLYKLEKERLLDDAAFAEQWARYRTGQKYGKHRIYQELRQKGVSEEDARIALEALDEEDLFDQAVRLAAKGFQRMKPEDDARRYLQKVIQSLVRRGFDWDTAKAACQQAARELDPENE